MAEKQHGAFTRAQALACGFSDDAIWHLVRTGRWIAVAEGVYRLPGAPRTWEQRLIALTYAAGPAAAASHRSAAALLGIPGFERRGLVEVTTPRQRRHRSAEALVHRWRPFPDHHLTVIDGIVTTRVTRTLCDLAGVLPAGRAERALDNCFAMRIATPCGLHDTFGELAGRGRRGTALMRQLIDARIDSYVAPASELEARFLDLLRGAGLPEPVRQYEVGDDTAWIGRVDFAYPPATLLIELDSARHHSAMLDVNADERRDAQLSAAGWRVQRFTWRDLVASPEKVVARLREVLGEDHTCLHHPNW